MPVAVRHKSMDCVSTVEAPTWGGHTRVNKGSGCVHGGREGGLGVWGTFNFNLALLREKKERVKGVCERKR